MDQIQHNDRDRGACRRVYSVRYHERILCETAVLEMQGKLCNLAAEHTARLASSRDSDVWRKSREEFWMLYFGPLTIVEDVESQAHNRVEVAMVRFGDELKKIDPASSTLPVSLLEQPALSVARACRDLLSAKWNSGVLKWFKQQ